MDFQVQILVRAYYYLEKDKTFTFPKRLNKTFLSIDNGDVWKKRGRYRFYPYA